MYNLEKTRHTDGLGLNKTILLMIMFISFLVILPMVESASPFTTNPQSAGCVITPIVRDALKVKTAFDFNFHVYNASNGYPLSNSTLSCYFHFYNQTGDHVFSTALKADPQAEHGIVNEWAERMAGGNISTIGTYAYIIQCNGTAVAGGCADKGTFTVTNSGYEATTGRALFDMGLLIVLVVILIGCVVIFMESDNLLAKVGMVGLGYLMLIAITFIAWQMANDFLLSASFLVGMFRILFFVLIIGFFPLLIGAFAWYLLMLFKVKEIERLMSKGLSEDEAGRRVNGRKRYG